MNPPSEVQLSPRRIAVPSSKEVLFWFALTFVVVGILYLGITPRNRDLMQQGYRFFEPEIALDAKMPFVPELVWPYYLYFPLMFSSVFAVRARRVWLYQTAVAFCIAASIGALFYVLLPSRIQQPNLHACPTLSCRALQWMYDADDGYHVFPSMHVALSTLSASVYWRFKRNYFIPPAILAFLIVLATVLCKRHFLVDVPAGFIVTLTAIFSGDRIGGFLCDRFAPKHGAELTAASGFALIGQQGGLVVGETLFAVVGGSGLYAMPGLEALEECSISTPFGPPSDVLRLGTLEGHRVAFLARHGRTHGLLPSEIPHRANMWALKSLGVKWLMSASAVGSLSAAYPPGSVVFPDQFFDRTKRASQESTFFGEGIVAHVSFGDPVCKTLRTRMYQAACEEGAQATNGGTYVNMEGPAFSTRAESNVHRAMGFDVVGMTNLAEAKLAREAEIAYASMSMVTDYDCWHEEEVSVELVIRQLHTNAALAARTIARVIREWDATAVSRAHTALTGSVFTPKEHWPETRAKMLAPILARISAAP